MPEGRDCHEDGPGSYLDRLTWPEAEALFSLDPLIVLPVGAAAMLTVATLGAPA